MVEILLRENELQLYRDAVDEDSRHRGPNIPRACYEAMETVLRNRGISGLVEKVTVEFVGCSKNYYLHYEALPNEKAPS